MERLKRQNGTASTRRLVGLRLTLSATGFALLGACAAFGPPETKTSRAYQDVDRQVLYERTGAALRASGLKVTATDPATGVVTAVGSFEGRNWAECSAPRLFVEDSEDRHYLIAVPDKDRRVALQASVSEGPQGATLTLDSTFTAEPSSPMATTPTCRTTGALEGQIFEAVAGAA
jgi:hypothetical protein